MVNIILEKISEYDTKLKPNNSLIIKNEEFLPISSINENNCLEFSNNITIQLLTKIIMFKRGNHKKKLEEINEDPRFRNYSPSFLIYIFKKIIQILESRKIKKELNPEEKKFIHHISLNLIIEKGKLNKNEALKIIKTKLFLDTSELDSEIFKIINSIKERNINLNKYSIPKYLLPKKTGMYLIEKKNQHLLGLGPKFLNINSHILFFDKQKVFGTGIIHSIHKEGIINNYYKILPFLIVTNENVVYTEDLDECEYPVKNVPFCVINYEQSELITKRLTGIKDFISIGARLIGEQLLKKASNSLMWYNLNYEDLLDMFEKRLIIHGPPSSGKSILGVQILRYISNKNRKVIAIAPSNPNLAKFGFSVKNIGASNPKWDIDNIGLSYLEKYSDIQIKNYSLITIGEQFYMPDIEKLSKKTILALINEVTDSVQIKNIIALEMVDKSILEILQSALNENLLDPEDFQQNQIKTLKRIANILLKWQEIGKKINLKEKIYSKDSNALGFHINSDLFLPELAFILLAEIFFNSEPCFDIKKEGLFLMVDEIPLLMTSDGVLIKGQNIGRIFTQINKQGRNMGILLGSIIQDYTSKIQNHFLPQNLNDYCRFHLDVKNKKRIIKMNNEIILIPPVTNI